MELEPTDNVALAVPPDDIVRLVGLIEAASPLEEDALRKIVPENPFRLTRLIVEVPADPATIENVAGLAVIVRSVTFTVIRVEWVSVPFEAETVTV